MGEGVGKALQGDSAVAVLRAEVEGLMGRCVLCLQSYELLLKEVLAESKFEGSPDTLASNRAKRRDRVEKSTMGALVTEFLGGTLFPKLTEPRTETETGPDRPDGWIEFRLGITLPDDEFVRVEIALTALVKLRNRLVHTFLTEHDMQTVVGCTAAKDALQLALDQIADHLTELRSWARVFDTTRQAYAKAMQSEEVMALIVSGKNVDKEFKLP